MSFRGSNVLRPLPSSSHQDRRRPLPHHRPRHRLQHVRALPLLLPHRPLLPAGPLRQDLQPRRHGLQHRHHVHRHRLHRQVGYALIVATESTGLNLYFRDNHHMLVTNCIFRARTTAALVTSYPTRRGDAKMGLVRTHHGADDKAYAAAIQEEDEDGNVGVASTKDSGVLGFRARDRGERGSRRSAPVRRRHRLEWPILSVLGFLARDRGSRRTEFDLQGKKRKRVRKTGSGVLFPVYTLWILVGVVHS